MSQNLSNKNDMGKQEGPKKKKVKRPATQEESAQITETLQKGLGEKVTIKKGEE